MRPKEGGIRDLHLHHTKHQKLAFSYFPELGDISEALGKQANIFSS
jgi:hypothetical protein